MNKKKLGDILTFQRGFDLTRSQMKSGSIPVVGSSEIIGWHNESKSSAPNLLIGRSGTVGRPQFYNIDIWPHNTTLFVSDFHGNDPKFAYYFLQNFNLEDYANSSGVPTLNRNFIEPLIVDYPEISSQQKISRTLSTIDSKIELNNKINSELEKMAKLIYEYWFVQFDFPDENGKPYKSSGGKMVWNEKLKKDIPEKWKVKKVSDFLDVVTGKEDANFASEGGKYAYFTCGRKVLKCNDAVFSGKSVLIAGNGSFDVKYYNGKFNAYQRVYVLKPRDEKFIGLIYRSVVRNISRFILGSQGSIVKFITKGDVENISILVPDNLELLTQLNSVLDMNQRNDFESEQLVSLRDWLLPMLMNGQVKLT